MAQREVRGGAKRLLGANCLLLGAVLAAYPLFYRAGLCSSSTVAYVIIAVLLFASCVLSVIIAHAIDTTLAVTFYCWAGFWSVAGMVVIDAIGGGRDFPWILYVLHAGALCLSRYATQRHARRFSIASFGVILLAGGVYRQWDQAIACALLSVIVAIVGANNEQ